MAVDAGQPPVVAPFPPIPLHRRLYGFGSVSGLGVFVAIAVMTAILALAVGVGATASGSDALTPRHRALTAASRVRLVRNGHVGPRRQGPSARASGQPAGYGRVAGRRRPCPGRR